MLGRLRMSIEDCIAAYVELNREVFDNPRKLPRKSKYSHERLESIIKCVVKTQLKMLPENEGKRESDLEDAPLFDETCCKT